MRGLNLKGLQGLGGAVETDGGEVLRGLQELQGLGGLKGLTGTGGLKGFGGLEKSRKERDYSVKGTPGVQLFCAPAFLTTVRMEVKLHHGSCVSSSELSMVLQRNRCAQSLVAKSA